MTKKKSVSSFALIWSRFSRKLWHRYYHLIGDLLKVRYRFIRYISYHYQNLLRYFLITRYRFFRRLRFRYLRIFIFFVWRLWVKEVDGFEKIPQDTPAIIVSNHLSYFDFWILSAILRKNTVFVAVKNLDKRSIVGWTMRLNVIVYIDRDKPGHRFFKEVMRNLKEQNRLVVVYPEGTRSRTGKMLTPKPGFVKLAIKAGVPIIPVAMKGTYEILPPHKHIPRLKTCTVFVGDKMYVSPHNIEFYDIFYRRIGRQRRYKDLDDEELQEVAFRIMNKVRIMAGEEWDDSVIWKPFQVPPDILQKQQRFFSENNYEESSIL